MLLAEHVFYISDYYLSGIITNVLAFVQASQRSKKMTLDLNGPPQMGGPRFNNGKTFGGQDESKGRRAANERLIELLVAEEPIDPVRYFSPRMAEEATLGWVFESDPNFLSLPGGYHLVDVADVCKVSPLTSIQVEGMVGAALVEDHIPGYGAAYEALFPVQGEQDPVVRRFNRRIRTLTYSWNREEDGHARVFRIILRLSNAREVSSLAEPEKLERSFDDAAEKLYVPPYREPCALFIYTAVQERATADYYRALLQNIENPVVKAALKLLHQQESRHCALFCDFAREGLRNESPHAIAAVKDLLLDNKFRMPLSDMIDGYLRMAIRMRRAAENYNAHDSLKILRRQVQLAANSRSGQRDSELDRLLELISPATA